MEQEKHVEQLLLDLQNSDAYKRKVAAEELRSLHSSSELIVSALEKTALSDSNRIVAAAARQALDAPVHHEILTALGHKIVLPDKTPPQPSDSAVNRPLQHSNANSLKKASQGKKLIESRSFLIKLGVFLLGVVLWCVPLLISVLIYMINSHSDWPGIVLWIGLIVAFGITVKGMGRTFVFRDGTPLPPVLQQAYACVAVIAVMATIIGLIWVFSWTGRGALRLYYRV